MLAAALVAAVAVPAAVIARGGQNGGPAENFVSNFVADISTDSKQYEPVGLSLPSTTNAMSATVSAQMTKGKAKFRLVDSLSGNPAGQPSSVLFSSKAANSFTFASPDNCPSLRLEWKRVGDAPAKAALVSYLAVYDLSACV